MAGAPDFRFSLAVGDSLLHGRHFGKQRDLSEEMFEGFQRRLRHHYVSEDTEALDVILGRQYHVVVGNPPFIQPKDAAMRDAYRELYSGCHGKYALGVPFIERFFDLAEIGTLDQSAGFVGLIVSNSSMKREFGAKLIEGILPNLDLTHVVDCAGVYIPGHGTPTVILYGRNREPLGGLVRTVRGIRGEPSRRPGEPGPVLMLSGRSWKVVDVDWPRRRVSVVPAEGGGRSRWLGTGRLLPFSISRAEERIITGEEPGCHLSRRAAERLSEIRAGLEFIDGQSLPLVSDGVDRITVWLFAGGLVSASVARAMTEGGVSVADWDDVSVTVRSDDIKSVSRALANLDPSTAHPALPEDILTALKFGLCLPPQVAEAVIVARTSNPAEVAKAVSRTPRRILAPRPR